MNKFAQKLEEHSISLRRGRPEILQVNVGKLCNLTCVHCHVNAGPKRKEIMTRETVDRVLEWLSKTEIPVVDLTGGAPEMIPDFCYFIERARALESPRHVIDRCNLTILLDPGPLVQRSAIARVTWVKPLGPSRWKIGCRFALPLSEPDIQDLRCSAFTAPIA